MHFTPVRPGVHCSAAHPLSAMTHQAIARHVTLLLVFQLTVAGGMPLGLLPARIFLFHTIMMGVITTVGANHTMNPRFRRWRASAARTGTFVTTKAVMVAMVLASIMVKCFAIRSGPFAPPS